MKPIDTPKDKNGVQISGPEANEEMARKLIKMKMPIEQVAEITELSKEEIKKI